MINKIQIRDLAAAMDIDHDDYQVARDLLRKINAFYITPFYEGTRLVRNALLQVDGILGVVFVPEAKLFLIRTIFCKEGLEKVLDAVIADDVTVSSVCSLEVTG